MKNLSLSISGSGSVDDELAARVEAVAAELRQVEGVSVSIAVSEVPGEAAATTQQQQAP
jgi:hypothetical protein